MSRKTITVTEEAHTAAATVKDDLDLSWSEFLQTAADRLRETEPRTEHGQPLTEDHIDDLAAAVARETAAEVEDRMTRR